MSRSFTNTLAGFACAFLAGALLPGALLPGVAAAQAITDCGATYAVWNEGPTEDTPEGDWARLFEVCRQQADAGNAAAQYAVGEMYRLGPPQAPAEDVVKAAEYFAKSAAQGNNNARFSLSLAYEDGNGIRKDIIKGIQWIRMAADDGFAPAQYYLGRMFRKGTSVPQSDADAFEWFSKAAAQGHPEATNALAIMNHEGQGTAVDHQTEMKWFRRAAEAGSGLAQFQLGAGYANAHGLGQDYVRGYMWINIAGTRGYGLGSKGPVAVAKQALAELMSAEDVAKAQKLSTACFMASFKGC